MSGVYRRPGSPHWYFSLTVEGRRVRTSTRTSDRKAAEIIAAAKKSETLIRSVAGKKPSIGTGDAFGRYLKSIAGLSSFETIDYQSNLLVKSLGSETRLEELSAGYIDEKHIAHRRGQVSDSSVNRELDLLRAVMRKADLAWGYEVAKIDWRALRLIEPDPRTRYLKPEEARRLIECAADHLKGPILFTLLTGVRFTNCITLDWSQVDMRARTIRFRVKSKKPGGRMLEIPMSQDILVLLAQQGPQRSGPVWLYKGKPFGDITNGWRAALRRAGIKDFRWHDLRHTAATWLRQNGVALEVVQKFLGHADIRTTQRYAHVEREELRTAADRLASHFGHIGTPEITHAIDNKSESK